MEEEEEEDVWSCYDDVSVLDEETEVQYAARLAADQRKHGEKKTEDENAGRGRWMDLNLCQLGGVVGVEQAEMKWKKGGSEVDIGVVQDILILTGNVELRVETTATCKSPIDAIQLLKNTLQANGKPPVGISSSISE
jgi:hypothetical protein